MAITIDELLLLAVNDPAAAQSHIAADRYIPLEQKQAVAQSIVRSVYGGEDGSGAFRRNSTVRYMLERLAMLNLYTDVDSGGTDSLEVFNKLNAVRFFDTIEDCVDARELVELRHVIAVECADAEFNEAEPAAFVRREVERFGALIGAVLGPMMERIDTDRIEAVIREYAEK